MKNNKTPGAGSGMSLQQDKPRGAGGWFARLKPVIAVWNDYLRAERPLLIIAALMFAVIHFTSDRIAPALSAGSRLLHRAGQPLDTIATIYDKLIVSLVGNHLIIPIKSLVFFGCMVALCLFAARGIMSLFSGPDIRAWRLALQSLIVAAIMAVLITPLTPRSLAWSYIAMTASPFMEPTGFYHRRLLIPVLARAFGFTDSYSYLVLSVSLTTLLIFSLLVWFRSRGMALSVFSALSISTASFICYNFLMPGYGEQLAYALFFFALCIRTDEKARLSLFILALTIHEHALFCFIPYVLFHAGTSERVRHMAIAGIYITLAILSYGTSLNSYFQEALYCSNESTPTLMLTHPGLWLFGIFISLKALWVFPIFHTIHLAKNRDWRMLGFYGLSFALALILIIITTDTSRHFNVIFPVLICALYAIMQKKLMNPRLITAILIINICIPSVYAAINTGISISPGLYKIIIALMQKIAL